MSDLPMCSCLDFWESHPPDCPVPRYFARLEAQMDLFLSDLELIFEE